MINTTQTRSFFTPGEELLTKSNVLFSYLAGAVVIAFVVCWLPYHIRRLMFCYVPSSHWTEWVTMWGTSSPCARRGGGVRLGLPGAELGVEMGIREQRHSPCEGLKPQPPNYCFVFSFLHSLPLLPAKLWAPVLSLNPPDVGEGSVGLNQKCICIPFLLLWLRPQTCPC